MAVAALLRNELLSMATKVQQVAGVGGATAVMGTTPGLGERPLSASSTATVTNTMRSAALSPLLERSESDLEVPSPLHSPAAFRAGEAALEAAGAAGAAGVTGAPRAAGMAGDAAGAASTARTELSTQSTVSSVGSAAPSKEELPAFLEQYSDLLVQMVKQKLDEGGGAS